MTIYYLILGILISIMGALPLGAVNVAVINTTITEDIHKALRIAIAAGIAEVLLALVALHCSIEVSNFFDRNIWIQILVIIIFMSVGIYFFTRKNLTVNTHKKYKIKFPKSKFLTGFSLAFLNPPVIIYWVVAISIINKYVVELSLYTSLTALFLFCFGIYLGKVGTLYIYSLWGNKITKKSTHAKTKLFKNIGIAFIVISLIQGIKIFVI